ncbi:unnamed protein product [Soboliphyme baturini]|uniref:Ldh_1_N domain-containing protein n=1 Tax=Soboliphyme baturini TaxID=241478 RepID=A0A183J643_9BILA|nr:unnamed protein product [Soboliphyme baturini]
MLSNRADNQDETTPSVSDVTTVAVTGIASVGLTTVWVLSHGEAKYALVTAVSHGPSSLQVFTLEACRTENGDK